MKNPSLKALASRGGKYAACVLLAAAALQQTARSSPSYEAAALSYHPVGLWMLNETNSATSGTVSAADFSGNGNAGTYGVDAGDADNGVTSPQPPSFLGFTAGEGALSVASADATSVVTLPSLNLGSTNDLTVVMWINPSGIPPTFAGLFFNGALGGTGGGIGFGFGGTTNAGGMPGLDYTWDDNNASTYNFNSGLYPVGGQWNFVAFVIATNGGSMYLDYMDPNTGLPDLYSAFNSYANIYEGADFANAAYTTWIGGDPRSTKNMAGDICGTAVYNYALTSQQILALFAAGVGVEGFAPSITGQPSSQYVVSGAQTRLSVTGVNGTAPITFQWQLNGTNVNLLSDSANFSGGNSTTLTILNPAAADEGTYGLIASNLYGSVASSPAVLAIQAPALVGEWLNGTSASTNLIDVSGYSLASNHSAFAINGGSVVFTNDAPPGKTGVSLFLNAASTGLAISNSSTLDGATYDNTFDDHLISAFTVSCWGRNFPAAWDPFVCKWGEGTPYATPEAGWQLRANGDAAHPCFTVRDGQIGTFGYGCNPANATDDMATTLVAGNDGAWHFYTGTYNAATGVRDLYVDGVLAAQETNNVLCDLAPFAHVCIGAKDTPPGDNFTSFVTNNVEIYDVCIYNYDLPQPQIAVNYGVVPVAVNAQPQAVAQFVSLPAQFVAGIGGTQPVLYQWQLNGTNIQSLADSANFTGANSSILTVLAVSPNDVGSYQLTASDTILGTVHTVVTQPASLSIEQAALVGEWLDGSPAGTNFMDVSGYSPKGTHDGSPFTGATYAPWTGYTFTTDVPPYRTGYSLTLPGDSSFDGIIISNSATGDAGYVDTFDSAISTYLTVSVWLKGTFGAYSAGWPPFVSKDGEGGGWEIRGDQWGSPGWTVRDNSAGAMFNGQNGGWDGNDDMSSTAGFDGNWHLYTGTYNSISGYRALYIDGNLSVYETGNTPYISAAGSHVMIGAEQSDDNPLKVPFEFYDVRIYNYELSAAQASALYNTLPPGTPAQIGIQPPASITTVCDGITVQINAQTGGSLPLTNQWQLNGTNLVDGNHGGVIISGSSSDSLTIANATTNYAGVYTLSVSNAFGGVVSSGCTLTVGALSTAPPPAGTLVGAWLTGAANLTDTSGYSPANTHDGKVISGTVSWTNDVPPGQSGQSLYFNNAGLVISNSSTADRPSYTDTFDDALTNAFTVMCWAKGIPGGWNPWVSKYGENNGKGAGDDSGWQLRVNGGVSPTWTIRGDGGIEDMQSPVNDDGYWHLFAGTYSVTAGESDLYMDGQLIASQTGLVEYNLAASEHLCIGAKDTFPGNSFGNTFTGEIYGVRIYDTALSQVQINSALVSVPSAPAFTGQPVLAGNQLTLTWSGGALLEATNLAGPWTATGATSPYTLNVTSAKQMFFKLVNP